VGSSYGGVRIDAQLEVAALRGVLAILFGVVAFLWPGLMWFAVVYTYAAYALVDGFFAVGMVVTGQARPG